VGRIGIPYVPDDTCIDANYVQNMHLLNWYHFGLMGKLRHLCRYLNDCNMSDGGQFTPCYCINKNGEYCYKIFKHKRKHLKWIYFWHVAI
jgi:hypothetical protein